MLFDDVTTYEDVRRLVGRGIADAMTPRVSAMDGVAATGELPLAVAEPGPLMAHTVGLAGPDGMTRQKLRTIFDRLDEQRFERGVESMMVRGDIERTRDRRVNRAGRFQEQVVFRSIVKSSPPVLSEGG